MLLTDDGALQKRIADPRHKTKKTYLAQVGRVAGDKVLAHLRRGVGSLQQHAPTEERKAQMHWLIKCRSKPNTDALRTATIGAHRNFLDGYPEVTWYSGPLFTDDNRNAIGSLRLIEFPDRNAALAYIHADPYTKAGIFQSISVERWDPRLDVRQRDYARKDGTMQFVIHSHDRPDAGARLGPLRDAHRDYLKVHSDIIVARGPLLDDVGVKTIGGVLILDVADKAQAEAFWADEPFNRAGLCEWTMERWRFGHV